LRILEALTSIPATLSALRGLPAKLVRLQEEVVETARLHRMTAWKARKLEAIIEKQRAEVERSLALLEHCRVILEIGNGEFDRTIGGRFFPSSSLLGCEANDDTASA
jgi:hypothetical protein